MSTAEEPEPSDTSGAKIGLAALCANWFKEVGLQGEAGELAGMLQQDYGRMVSFLQDSFGQVVAPGIISTVADARRAAVAFREARVAALLLVHIMWSEDPPLIALLEGCRGLSPIAPDWIGGIGGLPILLWNYHPCGSLPQRLSVNDLFRLSGTVGLLQGSAPLQRLGIKPPIVFGTPGDSSLTQTLREYAQALLIRREFQGMSAGRIAGRCEAMTGTFVDENALRERLGVRLVEVSAAEYAAACASVGGGRVDAHYADLIARFPVVGVSEPSLRLACRNALALDDLVLKHDLHALAIQDLDPELHRLAGIRPCLCPPLSAQRGVALSMEGDLNTALGMLATMRASSSPCMYTEVFTFDPEENILLMGHAAAHDPRLAGAKGVTIVPDAEYRHSDQLEGAWQEFILAQGPVTCVSLYDTGQGYRLTAFEGSSLGGPRRVEGFAHAVVRPAVPVSELLPRLVRRGMTQHFAIAPGHVSGILAKWCALSGTEFHLEE